MSGVGGARSPAPRVSVITIFLDPGRFLQEAVESVLAQSFQDLEYILVDDGSTDGSQRTAHRAAESDPRAAVVHHPGHVNRGMSASRNLGLTHARGELVTFLDADDVWLPDALERQVAWLDHEPLAAMVIGATTHWRSWQDRGGTDHVTSMGRTGLVLPPQLARERLHQRYVAPSVNATLARRRAVELVDGFEESFTGLYEDQAFFLKMFLRFPTFVHEELIDRYRRHEGSASERARQEAGHGASGVPMSAMRTFRAFAKGHIAASEWRGTLLHREARWLYRWDSSPRTSPHLYRFRPGRTTRWTWHVRRLLRRSAPPGSLMGDGHAPRKRR